MISIYHTPKGWMFCLLKESAYYSSLGDVMDAAYAAEDRAANYACIPQGRDGACDYCRSAKGCSVLGACQGSA